MRSALWAVVTVLALVSIACGGGTDENKDQAGQGGGAAGQAGGGNGGGGGSGVNCGTMASFKAPPISCGNGIVEPMSGEECEGGVGVTATCSSLGLGPGMVMCNPACCKLMQMCQMNMVVGGADGMTGAGTGG